jgi:hypothetical protein
MINAFKQIRLSNGVLISGYEGRVSVADSGSLAFTSEVDALQSGLAEATDNITGLFDTTQTLQSGLDLAFESISGIDERIDIFESGVTEGFIELGDIIDIVSGSLESTKLNVSGLSDNVNLLSSGLGEVLDTLSIHSGDIDNLKTGLNGALEVLVSHHDRLSGIDEAIFDLYSNLGGVDNSTQSFNYPIALGSEDITVLFPSGAFSEVPKINVTLISEVGYMLALRNKTVSGFGVSFSDTIQENDVSIDVVATIQS